ncbi:MAG: hypothetical protein Q7J84_14780 [Sulfuricaulis sp.]|nr:hypothetical protein [Sulfuricaulis sp.]
MTPIPITAEEIAACSAALRYQANDMRANILARHERAQITGLLLLANQIEDRFTAAATYAAGLEMITGDDE